MPKLSSKTEKFKKSKLSQGVLKLAEKHLPKLSLKQLESFFNEDDFMSNLVKSQSISSSRDNTILFLHELN